MILDGDRVVVGTAGALYCPPYSPGGVPVRSVELRFLRRRQSHMAKMIRATAAILPVLF